MSFSVGATAPLPPQLNSQLLMEDEYIFYSDDEDENQFTDNFTKNILRFDSNQSTTKVDNLPPSGRLDNNYANKPKPVFNNHQVGNNFATHNSVSSLFDNKTNMNLFSQATNDRTRALSTITNSFSDPWPWNTPHFPTAPAIAYDEAQNNETVSLSWSAIASKPAAPPRASPPPVRPTTPSPPPQERAPSPEFQRGPKVDPRWPVDQQVFLGPIPVSVTWEELRSCFYNKIPRKQVLHTYVQSKAVDDVVYGMIVLDKATMANKVVKDGPVKVRGHVINVLPMSMKKMAKK